MMETAVSKMCGPKKGERWSIGTYSLVFLGMGRNFAQEKFFIFVDGDSFFIITKDDFFSKDLKKIKCLS